MGDNIVLIGSKPPMSYVMAVITMFNRGEGEVILRARGRAITTAVDVEEIIRRRFLSDVKVDAITIGTEKLPRREGGGETNTSTIEIKMRK
jgi:DNA-binding protein